MSKTFLNWETAVIRLSLLTRSEWGILMQVSEGMDSKTISRQINIMPKSIDNYRNRIGSKLGLKGYGNLLHFATRHKELIQGTFEEIRVKWRA